MAAMDWAAERDSAVQFMQGLGAFVSQVVPLTQSTPGAGPYLLRLMQWAVSKFRVSGEIEGILDQAVGAMNQQLQNPPQPQPDPKLLIEAEKIKSNERIAMMETQSDEKVAALKATMELQKVEMQGRIDQMNARFDQIMQLMQLRNNNSQYQDLSGAVGQLAQQSADGQRAAGEQMQQLVSQLARRRKRIPIRDQAGNIVEVREVDDEPIVPGIPQIVR